MQQPPYGSPPRPLPHQRFLSWFRARTVMVKVLLSLLVLSCVLCTCVLSAVAGSSKTTQTVIPTDTPTTQALLVATATTSLPTDTPSPTPVPTATQTPRPTPKPQPTQKPVPTPTPKPHCVGINNNPWCYDFNPGKLIYVPPSGFCSYFNCIASFYGSDDPGDGYIIECTDSTFSQSGGERGACSSHGGELRPLYSH